MAREYEEKNGNGQYYRDPRRYSVNIVKEFFQGKRLNEINTLAIEDLENRRKSTKTKQDRERSGIVVNRELENLRVIPNKAILWGWIEKSPFKRFVEEEQKIFFDEGGARDRVLSPEEIKRLFEVFNEIPETKE